MDHSTIVAIATATGGAIGIIRLSGPDALVIADRVFRSAKGKTLAQEAPYKLCFGHVIAPSPDGGEELVDEVLASVFHAPNSYTGEDCVELNCHGSRYILQRVVELLIASGARMAEPGEFTKRAFLNGKFDLSPAEAVADLISCYSAATHRLAINQMRGGVSTELSRLREQLLHLTSLMELELDFSEEDVEFVSREELRTLAQTIEHRIDHLAESFHTGNAIKNGVTVAIIGAPNVGKSTLLNALLKEEKAIVSDIQGTTRDVIEDVIQIEGITFRFFDTAGIRKTTDRIEQMGIDRTIQTLDRAQIVLLLSEKGIDFPHLQIPADKTVLRVVNKSDITHPQNSFIYNKVSPGGYIHISALTGAGMPLLTRQLVEAAAVPSVSGNEPVITSLRHYQSLILARADIRRVLEALQQQVPCDLVSQDLRQCLHHLAEITGGEITSEDVLGSIFSSFCIGK